MKKIKKNLSCERKNQKKYIYISAVIFFIIMLNLFLIYSQKNALENIELGVEENAIAFIVNGKAQTTIPAKSNYSVTVDCTNGTASWNYDNWGIVINTVDKGNIKCNVEFNEKGYLRTSSSAGSRPFLAGPIRAATIESIEFAISNTVPSEVLGSWDVSENQDRSIMAWYYDRDSNGLYEVYIGQNGGVLANPDSSYLFYYMSSLKTLNLSNFDTSDVTNMYYMFNSTGRSSTVFTLDLGDKFDTSNVTNMYNMFGYAGYNSTVFTLDLGDKFDTSNVTDMISMFSSTGYSSTVFTLDLGDKFDTSNVTNMHEMFRNTGYSSSVFTLNLGAKFDTSNVTNMSAMFNYAGYSSPVFTLDLGDKFDTSNVTKMYSAYSGLYYGMFSNTGYNSTVFTLNLGSKFDTTNITNMRNMFDSTGYNSMVFTLNLGDKFDTSNVTTMQSMFNQTGYSSTVFTLDLGDKFDTSKASMWDMFNFTGFSNPSFILDLRKFNFDNVPSYYTNTIFDSQPTHIAYVKNISDKSFVSNKGFVGTIIDCSNNTCP